MRRPVFAANWKMHKTARETREFLRSFLPHISNQTDRDIVIAPPFPSLCAASEEIAAFGSAGVELGAQDVHPEKEGAFTGEVSLPMLEEFHVKWVIVGHSERRGLLGEDDAFIARKAASVLSHGMKAILCVGETLEEREAGKTTSVIEKQLTGGLAHVREADGNGLVIAYEPVWAIGTGKTASPEQAQEIHHWIRNYLERRFPPSLAKKIRILYGGSVNPGNIDALMTQPDIDGALVGGASLDPESFIKIAITPLASCTRFL